MDHFYLGFENIPMDLLARLSVLNPSFNLDAYFDKFQELQTNLERVNFVYKDLKKYNFLPKLAKDEKDDGAANEYREGGNTAFSESKFTEALRMYTCSVTTAKTEGVLALAFANRSACLYKLGKFKECITDINRAFAHNYPGKFKQNLLQRIKNAEKHLRTVKPQSPYHENTPQILTTAKHPKIQSAKDCVGIETNEEFGRHVVATRDIEIGEILTVEKPFAVFPITGRLFHCHLCLELCYNPLPCDSCNFLLFCSESCKDEAWESFHKYECAIMVTLVACGAQPTHMMALRVIFSSKNYNQTSGENADDYRSDRYKEIHNLSTGTKKREIKDLYYGSVTAALIFHIVRKYTKFLEGPGKEAKENFKETILLLMQIVSLNKLYIRENVENFFGMEWRFFAVGLYSFASLFNHSCCPNVMMVNYGSTVVLRTINTIKQGEQCYISYNVTYTDNFKDERRAYLKNVYFFDCKCKACENNWRLSEDLMRFRFPSVILSDRDMCDLILEIELTTSNVDAAKRYLPYLKQELKECEEDEPQGDALKIKRWLGKCYKIFGNKRTV